MGGAPKMVANVIAVLVVPFLFLWMVHSIRRAERAANTRQLKAGFASPEVARETEGLASREFEAPSPAASSRISPYTDQRIAIADTKFSASNLIDNYFEIGPLIFASSRIEAKNDTEEMRVVSPDEFHNPYQAEKVVSLDQRRKKSAA